MAFLVGICASIPGEILAQESDAPSPEDKTEEPSDKEPPPPKVTKDVNDQEWITPDVGAAEERDEEDAMEDVDEVIIEYAPSPDMEQDTVKDEEGEEIADVPAPVVSKAVEVQDPDRLESGADKDTGVQGQVASRRPKKVLPDAPVLAKGESDGKLRSTITDERGRYRLYLPPGKYTLRSYYDLYHGARWDNIAVTRGKFRRVNFVLDPISEKDAGVEEQEVVYLADTSSEAAQLNIRKEQVGVQDSISAEEIKRAGDSSAKGAAKRVVGVTIDEDDRIIVRGLSGRYNQILLNEIPIPGVDPSIPSVKLDIFPTEIVSNLAVVKVPRPDLPGAFAGGLLKIDSTNYPREFLLKIGASVGFNSMSAFRSMPTYSGGGRDWLGYDDGTRSLPAQVGNNRLDLARGSRYQTRDQLNQVGRTFPNVWNPSSRKALPDLNLKLTVGDSGDLKKKGRRAGYLLSFLYEYKDEIRTGFNKRFTYTEEGQTDKLLKDFDFKGGNQSALWGTFGSAFLELNPDNFLNITSLFSRVSDDATISQLGVNENTGLDVLSTKNSYNFVGRTVFFNQLTGDHRNLGDTKARLEWNAAAGMGRRDEPDRRFVEQQIENQLVTSATRYYAKLNQYFVEGKSSVRFPAYEAFESTAYLSVGINGGFQDRDFDARRFVQQQQGNTALIGDPEVLFDSNNLGVLSTIREVTEPEDSYTASNALAGGWVQLETPMAPWLSFLGGLRFEMFRQEVQSQSPFAEDDNPDRLKGTNRTDLDPLPSANFRFKVRDDMYVRLGYGMTVIRPAIRELAPFNYVDFVRGWNVRGNENLQRTRVQNAEARYEFFFGDTNLLAATAFFKYLDKPIEFIITNQINSTATFENADHAWLVGGELELRLGFGLLHEKLEKVFFGGNIALMKSQTTLPSDSDLQISGRLQRALFNQSPFVTNLSLRFDDPDSGVMVGLVYNAFGPRIVEAGSAAGDFVIPDVFEQTQHLLDLVATWKPTPHVKIGFKWKNIAFARKRFKQGDEEVLLVNRGTTVSIGAEYIY